MGFSATSPIRAGFSHEGTGDPGSLERVGVEKVIEWISSDVFIEFSRTVLDTKFYEEPLKPPLS